MTTPDGSSAVSRLTRVDLRDVWPGEATDFTPWLAESKNIQLISEAIGVELVVEAEEKDVGPFRADILCRDVATNDWVLIENQLERTDHIHLGQLMTYAAGLRAVTIVWVAARFTDEHRAALDWLNEITDRTFNFFGLEVELWRIGDSPVAPKFNIVSKPNDWTRFVHETAAGQLTGSQRLQREYWAAFKEHTAEHGRLKVGKPQAQNWMQYAVGRTGFSLLTVVSTWDSEAESYDSGEIRVEFLISGARAKEYFTLLEPKRDEIDSSIGGVVNWYNPSDVLNCRIKVRQKADPHDRDRWPEYHEWTRLQLERFDDVFRPIVRDLQLPGHSESQP